jgi:ankyrin repeat protein
LWGVAPAIRQAICRPPEPSTSKSDQQQSPAGISDQNQPVSPLELFIFSAAPEKNEDLQKLKAMLRDNPELVSRRNGIGYSPLHLAAQKGSMDVVELLLANKADINARAGRGATPLHKAAAEGHISVAELLLANKAEIDARDNLGRTALHWAVLNSHHEMVQLLLANNADVNIREKVFGYTALHLAALGHKDVAELLLAKGADVNAEDNKGQTPLRIATTSLFNANKNKDVVELLRRHGGHE